VIEAKATHRARRADARLAAIRTAMGRIVITKNRGSTAIDSPRNTEANAG
jgi:hypothetical protein